MAKDREDLIDLAASVARDGSPMLIDTAVTSESNLVDLLRQSGPERKVLVELPEELGLDDVSVEVTWFDEESGVVKIAPLRTTGLDEDGEKRRKRLQELDTLLSLDSESSYEDLRRSSSTESVASEEVREGEPVTKEGEEEEFGGVGILVGQSDGHDEQGMDVDRYEGYWGAAGGSPPGIPPPPRPNLVDSKVIPAKWSLEEGSRGFFKLRMGVGSNRVVTNLEGRVWVVWDFCCVRYSGRGDSDNVRLWLNYFSIAAEDTKYFLTAWDIDVFVGRGWSPVDFNPKDTRTDGKIVGEKLRSLTVGAEANLSAAPFGAGVRMGRSDRYLINREQRLWSVGAAEVHSEGVNGVGWMWKTTAWSKKKKATFMDKDLVSVRYCRGEVPSARLSIQMIPDEKPDVVFENTDKSNSVPEFHIAIKATFTKASFWPGRYSTELVSENFRERVPGPPPTSNA